MNMLVKIFVKIHFGAVRGSVYDEKSPLDTVYGAILSGSCKLNSWVTHEFVGNTSILAPAS